LTAAQVRRIFWLGLVLASLASPASGQGTSLQAEIDAGAASLDEQVIAWREDFHQHPELGNREFRTSGIIAKHLKRLGLEVRTQVAATGVVGVLHGSKPGPVVALRADMDAVPVTEEVNLPFRSTARTRYRGRDVGVMHAAGHDAHTAMLMAVAAVLVDLRERLPGTLLFVFQPAGEGAPVGEKGGAKRMLAEGVFDHPRPDYVLGLHVAPQLAAGKIAIRSGGVMASSDRLEIHVRGRQTSAAYPWLGVDPISVASRILLAVETIPGRQVDAGFPSVVSIGAIHGGVRRNIIPEEVELLGTIRTLEPKLRPALIRLVKTAATGIAESAGAHAEVTIQAGDPITWNDPALTERVRKSLVRVAGAGNVILGLPRTGSDDFAFFAKEVPGVYFGLGTRAPATPPEAAAPSYSPHFRIDESALQLGVRALASAALDLLTEPPQGLPSADSG